MKYLVFGNSIQMMKRRWQVWRYDNESDHIQPLAAYQEEEKSRVAAFELAHSAAHLEDPAGIEKILAKRDAEPIPFTAKEEEMLKILVKDAIAASNEPAEKQVEVSVRSTEYDKVFVVRYRNT